MARAWRWYLAAGALACLVYPLLPFRAADLAYLLVSLSGLVALVVGVVAHRPAHPVPWYLLSGGVAGLIAGDEAYAWYDAHDVHAPSPGLPDLCYLAGYALLFLALGLVVHRSGGARNGAAWLDAGIWTGGAVVAAWLPLLEPFAHDPHLTAAQRATALAYPAMDLVLLLLVVHQLSSLGRRSPSHRLLLLSMAGMLVADVAFGIRSLEGSYTSGELTELGWLVSYLAVGAAALHPRMDELTAPAPAGASHPTPRRTLALAVPAMAPSALLVVLVGKGDLVGDTAGGVLAATAAALVYALSTLRGQSLFAALRAREAALQSMLHERERLAEELRSRATRCDLTGLVNRAGFLELVTGALDSPEPMASACSTSTTSRA